MPAAESPAHGKSQMVSAFLLQPHVPGVVISQLNDEHPSLLGQCRGDLFHQLFLALDIHRREQFVIVNGLKEFLVLLLTLILGVREGRHVARAFQFQSCRTTLGDSQQFL